MRTQYFTLVITSGILFGCTDESDLMPPPATPSASSETMHNSSEEPSQQTTSETSEEQTVSTENAPKEYNKLTDFEEYVLLRKGTEPGGVGEYTDTEDAGTYICRRCNAQLYKSDHKFHSGCGWPAFDDEIPGAVVRVPETDGSGRTEIVCSNCQGHLGHVFLGERLTNKNTRHCVNSVSMILIPDGDKIPPTIRPESTKQ